MTNGFKGLDLIDRMPEELWMEVHNIVQEAAIKAAMGLPPSLEVRQLHLDSAL